MCFVWCHRTTRPTGRKIAEAIGCPSRFRQLIPGATMLLRWGNAACIEKTSIIQPAQAISKASDKLITLSLLKEHGIPCPEFSLTLPAERGDSVWFGRSRHGSGGRDIAVFRADGPYAGGHDFYTKYIPNTREYRIHVFNGEVLGIMGKYLDFPEQAGKGLVKNYAHGYRFKTPRLELKPDRLEAAKNAVAALGLDFGAVDLLIGQDGNPYVLEVNSAPGLAPLTLGKYVDAIRSLADERGYSL